MKSIVSLIMLVSLFSATLLGQKYREIQLPFKMEDFSVEKDVKGQVFLKSSKYDIVYKPDSLSPALPYVGVNILVGPSESYESVDVHYTDDIVADEVVLTCNPRYVIATSLGGSSSASNQCIYESRMYPGHNVEYVGSSVMKGYKIMSFLVAPFRYDMKERKLIFNSSSVLQLMTNGGGSKGVRLEESEEQSIKALVINGSEISTLYEKSVETHTRSIPNAPNIKYLIITNELLKTTFQVLADWKTKKGVPTEVITTEDISIDYSGSTLQSKIKSALKNYYDNSTAGFKYALLGGDVSIVPTTICYATYDGLVRNMPTDLYYACFDTMDWDSNGNGIIGEVSDSVDFVPEIYVSRAPVMSVTDAESFVNRVISYESNPVWTGNAEKILMGGAMRQTYYNTNMGVLSDSHWQSYNLYKNYVMPYWTGDMVEFFDTHTDFPGDASYEYSSSNLQSQLGQGYGFVHIMSHGNPYVWAMEDSNDIYSVVNASSLDNQGETIVVTSSCLTNAFDSVTTCLSESFIRNPDSGILAYVGCSREGWGVSESFNVGPSNLFDGAIFRKIFTLRENNFARSVAEGKNGLAPYCYTYDFPYRWILFGLNPLGDPEMPIFTSTPLTFDNVSITSNNLGLEINASIDSCRICIMGQGNPYYLCLENVTSVSAGDLTSGDYNVCVTKPGYKPYNSVVHISGAGSNVYVQNTTFNSDAVFIAPNVIIGSDVNPSETQGPVSVESGASVRINASQSVRIMNGFKVKLGGVFEITN